MDIFLVRHGEAAASWSESPDPGLSDLGRQQALAAAEQLKPLARQDTLIITSPLQRARETAEPLANMLQYTVLEDAAFREIPSPASLAQRQAWLRQFMRQQWHEQGADLIAWRDTALAHLLMLERPAVVFTHFLVINAVVGRILDRTETLCFWPANGSVTRLRRRGSSLELLTLGQELETRVN